MNYEPLHDNDEMGYHEFRKWMFARGVHVYAELSDIPEGWLTQRNKGYRAARSYILATTLTDEQIDRHHENFGHGNWALRVLSTDDGEYTPVSELVHAPPHEESDPGDDLTQVMDAVFADETTQPRPYSVRRPIIGGLGERAFTVHPGDKADY